MARWDLTTNASELFKIKYGKLSENVYNSSNVLLARINKKFDFTGSQLFVPIPQSFSGGVGSGTLPIANASKTEDALILSKKVYATTEIDRESIKAASNDEGSFVRLTKYSVQKAVESYMRNASRILFNDGSGKVALGDGVTAITGTGTSGDPWLVTLDSGVSNSKEGNIEDADYWDNDATDGSTNFFEVQSYNAVTRVVALVDVGSPAAPTNADQFYMQGSKNNDPQGLLGVLDATAGTLYSIPVARRWQATQEDAGGAGLIPDLMNKVMLDVQRKSGKVPNLIVTSFTQYRKLLNQIEDQKYYVVEPRNQDLKGKISFTGIEFMSAAGPIPVFPERFCEEDRMYFLNDNFITTHHRPDFGWFDDDGTVFLRKASDDAYEARYGGYLENYIVPVFHGVLDNLAL